MPTPHRHIEGIDTETLVRDLARTAVKQRLAAVTTCFPLAAEAAADNHERVHQLRVSTRRAVAALILFKRFCPRRRTARLLRDLKQIRRAAGRARDLDVFTTRLATSSEETHQELLQSLTAERQTAQKEIVDLFNRFAKSNRLDSRIGAVSKRLHPRGTKAKRLGRKTVAEWAPRCLRKAAKRLLEAVPTSLDQAEKLHPLRVEGKQCRYTLELLAAGLPDESYDDISLRLKEFQDRLGAINDHDSAINRLSTHALADRAAIDRLIVQERASMLQAIENFQTWFAANFLLRLQEMVSTGNDGPATAQPLNSAS